MRDDDFWNRDFRHHQTRRRSVWDEHAEAMALIVKGNQNIANEIAGALGHLWRGMRRRLNGVTHDQGRQLPPM
jgi:hypothetical protein